MGKDADKLGTLAAGYAESGDFNAAVKWQENVVVMYKDEADLLKEASARLALVRVRGEVQFVPHHEDPKAR